MTHDPDIEVPVEIRAETELAWCYRVIGATGFRPDHWIQKSMAEFRPCEELSKTPSGIKIRAGYMKLPGRVAAARGAKPAITKSAEEDDGA